MQPKKEQGVWGGSPSCGGPSRLRVQSSSLSVFVKHPAHLGVFPSRFWCKMTNCLISQRKCNRKERYAAEHNGSKVVRGQSRSFSLLAEQSLLLSTFEGFIYVCTERNDTRMDDLTAI